MFKRPRGSKDRDATASVTNKRLKEDSLAPPRHSDDYASLTYYSSNACSAATNPIYQAAEITRSKENTSPLEEGELARYNRLKIQQKGSKKPKTGTLHPNDSDNGSIVSEVIEVHNEKEHYNKLKVDVNKIQSNMKLIKGVKVLAQSCSEPTIHRKISTHKSARVTSESSENVQLVAAKYKKEGHVHQIHSVTCLKVPAPLDKQMYSPSLPKSRSMGDILQDSQSEAPAHKVSHSNSLYSMESVTSLTNTQASSIPQLTTSAVTPQSGVALPLSAKVHTSNNSSAEHSFMSKTITFLCTHEGKEVNSAAYDFSVQIPKGAIRKRKMVEFHMGVCLHGPFVFPKGYNLISPILMVTSPTTAKLKKHTEISLPYCIDLTPQSQRTKQICFFRANSICGKTAEKQYTFQPTNMDHNQFEIYNSHGRLKTLELGFFCIMAKDTMETRKQTKYCILPVVPKCLESSTWKVHYYVIHFLKAFMMEIEDGLGSNWKILPPKQFKLETRISTQKREKIEINFQQESGWMLSLESTSKIHTSDIDSWSNNLTKECNKLPHPPRFTIRVCGDNATLSSCARVWFTGPGMSEDINAQLNLPLNNTPLSSAQSLNLENLSSLSSSSIHFSPLAGSLASNCSDYDHLPSRDELDQTHIQLTYHNGYIDFPTDEALQTVACEVIRAMDRDWTKLQVSLGIPDYIIQQDIQHQKTQQQQVFRLLKEWRQHSQNSSKEELARLLRRTDTCLHTAADILLTY